MAKIRCHQLFPLGINYLIAARLGKQPLASRLRIALRENLVEVLQTIGNQWRDAGQPDSFFVYCFNAQRNHNSDFSICASN